MKKVVFPQGSKVPEIIKEKVMAYVTADMNKNPSLIRKWTLSKILIPNLVVLLLVVSVISFVGYRKPISDSNINPSVLSINSTTPKLNLSEHQVYEGKLEDKLLEAEILLQELEQMGEII